MDIAVDAYFNNPSAFASSSSKSRTKTEAPSVSKLNQLFNQYKGQFTRNHQPALVLTMSNR